MDDTLEAEGEELRMALPEQSRARVLMAPLHMPERRAPRRQANTGNNDLLTPPRRYPPIEEIEWSSSLPLERFMQHLEQAASNTPSVLYFSQRICIFD